MTKILLVDDKREVLEIASATVKLAGHNAICAMNGDEAEALLKTEDIDLILLDIMMPGTNGIDLCKRWKSNEKTSEIPIIILSAKDSDEDIVTGLNIGADDYIEKPFRPKVLNARINSVLKRGVSKAEPKPQSIFKIDKKAFSVSVSGEIIERLTTTEFKIFELLSKKPGRVFTREKITSILKSKKPLSPRTIDTYIRGLRKKLGEHSYLIESISGIGYCFTAS